MLSPINAIHFGRNTRRAFHICCTCKCKQDLINSDQTARSTFGYGGRRLLYYTICICYETQHIKLEILSIWPQEYLALGPRTAKGPRPIVQGPRYNLGKVRLGQVSHSKKLGVSIPPESSCSLTSIEHRYDDMQVPLFFYLPFVQAVCPDVVILRKSGAF